MRGQGWTGTLSGTSCPVAPAVAYGMVFAGDCSYVSAFNAPNGTPAWTFSGGAVTGVSVANHIVYACASNAIVALNAGNGALLWTGAYCSGVSLVANGIVYGSNSFIYAFTIPSLSPGIAHAAPVVANLRRERSLRATRTPEQFALNR